MPELFYNNFTGGINNTQSIDVMADNELRKCVNAWVHNGGIEKRKGSVTLNKTSYNGAITQLFEFTINDGSSYLAAIIDSNLYLINNGERMLVKTIESTKIPYVMYLDQLYFIDHVGEKFYIWGYYKYLASQGTQSIASGDVVKFDADTSNKGNHNHYYKAQAAHGSVDLSTEDFTNTNRWDDVTYGTFCNNIVEVTPYSDPTNDLSGVKKCKYFEWHQPSMRFFAAGNPDDPTAVYFSEIAKPNFFKEVSKVYPTSSSGAVTGIRCMEEAILVSYKYAWYYFSGIFPGVDAVWKPLAVPFGAVSNSAIVLTPESLTFVSTDAIRTFNPSILSDNYIKLFTENAFADLSSIKIKSTIDSMINKDNIQAVWHDNMVFIAYCDETGIDYNNKVLAMHWPSKSFVIIDGWRINTWVARKNGDLLFAYRNYIMKAFVGTNDAKFDDGFYKMIEMSIETKPYNLGTYRNKEINHLFITGNNPLDLSGAGGTQIGYRAGNESTTFYANLYMTDTSFTTFDLYAEIRKSCFRFQVVINNTLFSGLYIYAIGFDYEVLNLTDASLISRTPLLT